MSKDYSHLLLALVGNSHVHKERTQQRAACSDGTSKKPDLCLGWLADGLRAGQEVNAALFDGEVGIDLGQEMRRRFCDISTWRHLFIDAPQLA
jgi:hypothetical protein